MPDLYHELGVARDATDEEIKRAHRQAVRRTHPDTGGNPEEFHRVQKAYNVLSDHGRRARYDLTGDATEVDPEQLARRQAMTTVAGKMNALISDPKVDPCTYDLVLGIKELIAAERQGIQEGIRAGGQMISRLQQFERRLKRKKKEGPDAVQPMITAQIEAHRGQIAQLEDGLKVMALAIELVEEYVYRTDPVQQQVYVQGLYAGGSRSWFFEAPGTRNE